MAGSPGRGRAVSLRRVLLAKADAEQWLKVSEAEALTGQVGDSPWRLAVLGAIVPSTRTDVKTSNPEDIWDSGRADRYPEGTQ